MSQTIECADCTWPRDCDRLFQRDRHHFHFRLKFKVDPIEVALPPGSAGAIRQDLPAPPLGRRLLGPSPRIARRFHVVAERARQHVGDRNNASLVRIGKKACFACRPRRFVLTSLDPFDPRGPGLRGYRRRPPYLRFLMTHEVRRREPLSTRRSIRTQVTRPDPVDVYPLHDEIALVGPRRRGGSGRAGIPYQEDRSSQYGGCDRRQNRKTADFEKRAGKSHGLLHFG